MRDYSSIAVSYCRDVLSGAIPACEFTKLACKRHLDDLAQTSLALYPWKYDQAQAHRACTFVEQCPQVKGKKWFGRKLILEPWQVFILCAVFGWLSKATSLRRFRTVYTEVAKGNGKSALSSAVALYMGFMQSEQMGETYSAATTRDQAKVVFATSQQMLRNMPEFQRRAGIEVGTHAIYQASTASTYKPLSSDAGGIEGSTPSFTIFDELHAADRRELFDNLSTATGKRDNSLLWIITTAGSNLAGVCYEQHDIVRQILQGLMDDPSYFGIIYSADKDDDVFAETTWRKANPNYGISVSADDLAAKANRAKQVAGLQPAFKTKHCNIWCQTDHAWLDMAKFQSCADPNLKESDFHDQDCVLGLDIAARIDLAASVRLFWKRIDGKVHYYAFGTYWTPQARVDASTVSQYKGWAESGQLQVCTGNENDFAAIEQSIREDCAEYKVLYIAHDPAMMPPVTQRLKADNLPCVDVTQNVNNLSNPMKELEAAVNSGRFHYNGDPILAWAASNVICHPDRNENLFPNKLNPVVNKIDPITALLCAMNRVQFITAGPDKPAAVYQPFIFLR